MKNYISVLIAFFALGFLIFGSALDNPFIMDDEIQVTGNSHIKNIEEVPSFFSSSSMDSGGGEKMWGMYYKPLMTSYYAVIWHFFQDNPTAFRVPLLVIHILSSFLVFIFSLVFLSRGYAVLAGLVFLLHPVNNEVVVYIADAQDIFYFFFGMLALLSVEKLNRNWSLFLATFAFFTLGLLSKETGALFLLMAGAYVVLLHPRKWLPVFTSATIVGLAYLFIRFQIGLTETKAQSLIFHSASYLDRIRMLPMVVGHYIEIYFFPWRLSLATDVLFVGYPWQLFWLPLAEIIAFVILMYWLLKKFTPPAQVRRLQFFAAVMLFWFLLHTHVLVPLDGVYADRWFYIGVWALTSVFLILINDRISQKKMMLLTMVLTVAMGARSYYRSLDWADPLRLYTREAELHPWDATMVNNVGVILFRDNKILQAEPYFEMATQLNTKWNVGLNNLGAIKEYKGEYDKALELYIRSINAGPYPLAYENYARLLIKVGQRKLAYNFLQQAALPLFPKNPMLLEFWKQVQDQK